MDGTWKKTCCVTRPGLFEGVDVNLYELPVGTHVPDVLFDVKQLLVKNKAGWIDSVRFVAGEGLKGVLHFLDSATWLGKNLVAGMKSGAATYGLSYDCPVRAKKDTIDGRSALRALKFLAADSVDIVTRPAAGGKFNRAIAAQNEEGLVMNKKQLWDLIMRMRADALEGKTFEEITEDELRAVADELTPAQPAADPPATPPEPASQSEEVKKTALRDGPGQNAVRQRTADGITGSHPDNVRRSGLRG